VKPNPGYCPAEAEGKNVRVRLVSDPEGKSVRTWPASGKGACNWTIRGFPFDIAEYEVTT
jgi:hypothetical protein